MTTDSAYTDLGSLRADPSDNSPVRFLHSSDLHLGAAVSALTAFENLVNLALQRQVDLVVLGGDVYDNADRSVSAQMKFHHGLKRLCEAGIRVFIAHGNHDPVQSTFTPVASLPEGVYTFTPGEPQTFMMLIGTTKLAVLGVSFASQKEENNLVELITQSAQSSARGADLRIAVVHANVAGLPGHDNYAGCTQQDLNSSTIDYWALGHIHDRTVTPMPGNRWWAYPGNLQGRSTKATECGPKGVLIVEASDGGFAEPEFVPCDSSRYERIQVDVSNSSELTTALDLISQQVRAAVEQDNPNDLPTVVRISVHGASPAHMSLLKLNNESNLDSSIAEMLPTHVSVKKVSLETHAPYDRNQLILQKDVVGAVLTELDKLRAQASQPNNSVISDLVQGSKDLIGSNAILLAEQAIQTQTISSAEILDQVERLLLEGLVSSTDQQAGSTPTEPQQ